MLLLLGKFGAHFDPRVLDIAAEHNVHMLAFPAHSTHNLQPLDVGVMQPLEHHCTQVRKAQAAARSAHTGIFLLCRDACGLLNI